MDNEPDEYQKNISDQQCENLAKCNDTECSDLGEVAAGAALVIILLSVICPLAICAGVVWCFWDRCCKVKKGKDQVVHVNKKNQEERQKAPSPRPPA